MTEVLGNPAGSLTHTLTHRGVKGDNQSLEEEEERSDTVTEKRSKERRRWRE